MCFKLLNVLVVVLGSLENQIGALDCVKMEFLGVFLGSAGPCRGPLALNWPKTILYKSMSTMPRPCFAFRMGMPRPLFQHLQQIAFLESFWLCFGLGMVL